MVDAGERQGNQLLVAESKFEIVVQILARVPFAISKWLSSHFFFLRYYSKHKNQKI